MESHAQHIPKSTPPPIPPENPRRVLLTELPAIVAQLRSRYANLKEFARDAGCMPATLRNVSRGTLPNFRLCQWLYEKADRQMPGPPSPEKAKKDTHLRWRRRNVQKLGDYQREYLYGAAKPVPLIYELAIDCGLLPQDMLAIRMAHIEDDGIHLSNGRAISFGDGWEQVKRNSLDGWIEDQKPTNYVFFRRNPVDRNRPANSRWIVAVMHAHGVKMKKYLAPRFLHFAHDLIRIKSRTWLRKHLQETHKFSRGGAWDVVRKLDRIKSKLLESGHSSAAITAEMIYGAAISDGKRPVRKSTPSRHQQRPSEAEIRKGEFCAKVIEELRQIRRLYIDSGWSVPEIQAAHPQLAAWSVRDSLAEEDREILNHPRQWGPVVGYAHNVLAKSYKKHPSTVKGWVKRFKKARRTMPA